MQNLLLFLHLETITKTLKKLFFALLLCFIPTVGTYAQCLKIDSLQRVLAMSIADTTRLNTMNLLGREYLANKQPWAAMSIANQAYTMSQSKNYKIGMGDALLVIGDVNFQSDDITKRDNDCLPNYTKALEFFIEAKAYDRTAIAYKTLGDFYYNVSYQKSEYEKQALDHYLHYLKASEKSGNKAVLAEAYERVGYLYETLGDDANSTAYFLKVINIRKEIEEKDVKNPHLYSKTQKFYDLQIENQRLYSYILLGGVVLLLILAFLLYLNLNYRRRAHRLLQYQKEEIQKQKEDIEIKNVELAQQNEEISAQHDQLTKQTEQLSIAQIKVKQANELLTSMNVQLEAQVAQRTEQLQKSNQMLMESNRELDTLIYRASHDFKGPVATLTGLSYIGKMECMDIEPALDVLDKIEDVAKKMDKMLEKLHQVSHIIGKNLELKQVDLQEVIENATYTIDAVLQAHPIQIQTSIAPHFVFEADEEILQMMLENIIENAGIYRREDALPAPALHIIADSDEQTATLTFEDNGFGISSNFLPKAFEMFTRGSELAKGNGLGLYVVKQGLERMFGTEHVQSIEDMFTRLILTFDKKAMSWDYRTALLKSLNLEEDADALTE